MLNEFGLNGLCFACGVGCKGERGWWVKRGGGLTPEKWCWGIHGTKRKGWESRDCWM